MSALLHPPLSNAIAAGMALMLAISLIADRYWRLSLVMGALFVLNLLCAGGVIL